MVAAIYTTIDNIQDARKIAQTLVEEQLVACANIIPEVESIYRWEGKIENDNEVVIIAKTTDPNVKKTIQRLKKLNQTSKVNSQHQKQQKQHIKNFLIKIQKKIL